jgi:hypothetical protein
MVPNFLIGGDQKELLRPQGVHMLIRLSTAEREAILASMPHCDEWGHVAVPAAQEVATRGADEDRTMVRRSHLFGHILVT